MVKLVLRGCRLGNADHSASASAEPAKAPKSRLKEVSLAGKGSGNGAGIGNAKRRRVLVCAPSNAAIDEVVRRLTRIRSGSGGGPLRVVRVGRHFGSEVEEYSLERLVQRKVDKMTSQLEGKRR
jgi:hypothetical protein